MMEIHGTEFVHLQGRQWRKYFSALRLLEIRFYTLISTTNWTIVTDGEQ
jgi:hypothetical protein